MATGGYVSAGRTRDGRVLAAGSNVSGQVGNGARLFRSTASRVPGLPAIVAVEASFGSGSYAVGADGSAWSWGGNDFGELGDGGGYRSSPAQVPGLGEVVAIAAGGGHTLALRRDGGVYAWGRNDHGQVGAGAFGERQLPPVSIAGLFANRIAAGQQHSLALQNGTVRAWGRNTNGQLGDGTTTDRALPVPVQGLAGVVDVSAGEHFSVALKGDGTVWAWGLNQIGLLGPDTGGNILVPAQVPGLRDIVRISAANYHVLALDAEGHVWSWGWNDRGQLGDGTSDNRAVPAAIAGLSDIVDISAKNVHSAALRRDGVAWTWGENRLGQLGDGTLVDRVSPVVALREEGAGSIAGNDWFLDLEPSVSAAIPAERVPVFPVVVSGSTNVEVSANVRYRPEDVGTQASTFVFALAPANLVQGAAAALKASHLGMWARGGRRDTPIACALAQLNAQGQLIAVSAASLQAYVSGVLSSQGQSVRVLSGVSTPAVAGATFYVGYGPNGNAMLINGTTRSAVTIPASVTCSPQPPQTGWWYNPAEPGRGFSIEARGNRLFFAAFHYEANGRATWNFAGGATSLDGSLFASDFLAAANGQTLTGPYRLPGVAPAGSITFAFSDATHGTMTWPGGNVAIERQPYVPNGLTAPAQANVPEGGWWWNPQESGRGFFIEWQNGFADLAGYMYDDAGNPTWYISAFPTPNPRVFEGSWWSFANGQSMGGAFRPAARVNDNVGSVRIDFNSTTTATMTLPDGRRIALERQRF